MRVRLLTGLSFFLVLATVSFGFAPRAEAEILFSQPDNSGELISQQPTFVTAFISSSLGNLALPKDELTLTFTIQDPNASNVYGQPGGVALGSCFSCNDLQTYYFTSDDRRLLSDGAPHTLTVQTGTTASGIANGENPIYLTFFNLSQYQYSTHVKSNAAGTMPSVLIEGSPYVPSLGAPVPSNAVTLYSQTDNSSVMLNPQPTFLNGYIDSQSLGNVALGQGPLFLTVTLKDPNASNVYGQPGGICLEPFGSVDCGTSLQTYYFTDADRALLADGGFHTFVVETGTTTNTYADGTQPVAVGFFGLSQYQYGTQVKSNAAATIPYLVIQAAPPPDPCAGGGCASNVLFLPGIEGSRLYEGTGCGKSAEEKLWEPLGETTVKILKGAGDEKVKDLFLDENGKSVCSDIYTKDGDIINSVHGSNLYKSFIEEMNGLKSDGTIADWKPVSYDWRLSLTDLLHNGAERDGKIFYEEASSTPYIEQTLRSLAASSKTGKVTIIAHSNGGLVTKALLNSLGDSVAESLVDKVILVGVPQSGAPFAVGAMLFGLDQGISSNGISILHSDVARTLADNSPMAYHLLPSEDYLEAVAPDFAHRVASFAGDAYAKEIAAYGSSIANRSALADFLLAKEGGRQQPAASDTSKATILNSSLLDYAVVQHAALDFWTPPVGIEVTQIAGWGVDTVSGIDFYSQPRPSALSSLGPTRAYRPVFTEDGDGTVPTPSALEMSSSLPNVKRYWLNLKKSQIKHGNLFEDIDLQKLVDNLLENSLNPIRPTISTITPISSNEKKLTFFLHSPLTLQLTDSFGNVTGLGQDDSITEDIPDSTYGEFGDVKYVTVPEGGQYHLTLHGQDTGTFSLDIQETVGGTVTNSSTVANVPTTASTFASLTISGGVDTASDLSVDENGDGSNLITITPETGQTVTYESPSPTAPSSQASSSGGGAISLPVTALLTVTVASNPEKIVATTSVIALLTKAPQQKKKVTTIVLPKKTSVIVPQTASVYQASQQPIFSRMGVAVYNGFNRLWSILLNIF